MQDDAGRAHPPPPLQVVLIGPPGAGKSTLVPALVETFALDRIGTGDLLREEIEAGTPLGRTSAGYVERGELVPDAVIEHLLRSGLAAMRPGAGLLLDGYPRSVEQARTLDALLAELGRPIDVVLALEVPDDEILHRLGGRRLCTGAGEPWVLHLDDAAAVARCRAQGGTLEQREDDRPEVIARRLAVYRRQTEPLLAAYRAAGLLREIDATGSTADVRARAIAAVRRR
jgi:adenylate kinase